MDRPEHPSDALALVASALHELEVVDDREDLVPRWLAFSAESMEDEFDEGAPKEWLLAPEDLFKIPALAAVGKWPPKKPHTAEEFLVLTRALQALDRWHKPVVPQADGLTYERLEAHEVALDNLAALDGFGLTTSGLVIPARATARNVSDFAESHSSLLRAWYPREPGGGEGPELRPIILRELLEETTYLPAELDIPDPDGKFKGEPRHLRLTYRRRSMGDAPPRLMDEPLTIGIAPMALSIDDAEFELSACRSRYGVRPAYPADRINEVVQRAAELGVELLLLPELTVAESELPRLSQAILSVAREHAKTHHAPPALRYVFAGVAGEPRGTEEDHQNYVVVLNAFGQEIMRQSKLFRWDLDTPQIYRFGLQEQFGDLPETLRENISDSAEITVLDLPDIGRILTLICADANYDTPGDWLLTHMQVDWLHAPIMDQSTSLFATGVVGPWISRRAHRAACAGHGRVLVTNSMSLTRRVNATNVRDNHRELCFDICGIGLLVDATTPVPTFAHVQVKLDDECLVEARVWGDGWSPFRDPPPTAGRI